ncbi:hypothetical protein GIB67_035213 [Kingdonia uniflora]|uniref:Uncharacterized protein n=1 Tax=Kingdonia uniflora TaxID=39325 RepID=A0A7J7KXV9_9MAGN|nr:hypothetical protein GIB67_035213 [Kingdonia uniflora]
MTLFYSGNLRMESHGISNIAKCEYLLFDIDDTLYPLSLGLNIACRTNIEEYMVQYLKIEASEVPKMCLELYEEYGTTMAGLKALGYEFDNDEYHAFVHGRLPYERLKPDAALRNLLLSIPQHKIIFTNADEAHAAQVLHRLGLEDCFEGIICFETLNPPNYNYIDNENEFFFDYCDDNSLFPKSRVLCKPSVEAFEAAILIANVNPSKTVFFDDSVRNIASAKVAGLNTVIVGSSVVVPGADVALESIHNIREALPETWEGEEECFEQVLHCNSVETVVHA